MRREGGVWVWVSKSSNGATRRGCGSRLISPLRRRRTVLGGALLVLGGDNGRLKSRLLAVVASLALGLVARRNCLLQLRLGRVDLHAATRERARVAEINGGEGLAKEAKRKKKKKKKKKQQPTTTTNHPTHQPTQKKTPLRIGGLPPGRPEGAPGVAAGGPARL